MPRRPSSKPIRTVTEEQMKLFTNGEGMTYTVTQFGNGMIRARNELGVVQDFPSEAAFKEAGFEPLERGGKDD